MYPLLCLMNDLMSCHVMLGSHIKDGHGNSLPLVF